MKHAINFGTMRLLTLTLIFSIFYLNNINANQIYGKNHVVKLLASENNSEVIIRYAKQRQLKAKDTPSFQMGDKIKEKLERSDKYSTSKVAEALTKFWNDSNSHYAIFPSRRHDLLVQFDLDEVLELFKPKTNEIQRVYGNVKFTISDISGNEKFEMKRIGYFDAGLSKKDMSFLRDFEKLNIIEVIILNAFTRWLDNEAFYDDLKPLFEKVKSVPVYDSELVINTSIHSGGQAGLKEWNLNQVSVKTNGKLVSGIVVSDDGYVLCVDCLQEGNNRIDVFFANGDSLEANFVRSVDEPRVALIKVESNGLHHFDLMKAKGNAKVGQSVFAISTPINLNLQGTVSGGIISRIIEKNGTVTYQTDASISNGSEGGALTDENGNLIGLLEGVREYQNVQSLSFTYSIEDIKNKLNLTFR